MPTSCPSGTAPPAALPALAAAAALLALLAGPAAAPPASAQDTADEAYLTGQPPLADADIPAAVETLIFFKSPEATGPRGPELLGEIAGRHGVTADRLRYLRVKCSVGIVILLVGSLTDEDIVSMAGTPLARPTPDELEVIGAHRAELTEAIRSDTE
jgi:hypothetical protein